jgi:hypothetical protein
MEGCGKESPHCLFVPAECSRLCTTSGQTAKEPHIEADLDADDFVATDDVSQHPLTCSR